MVKLITKRLIIRDHVESDLPSHHKLFSHGETMYYMAGIQTNSMAESQADLLYSVGQAQLPVENREACFFRIEDRYSLDHIGEIGYTVEEETPIGKIVGVGYFLGKDHWGRGYTTEALKAVMTYAFLEGGVIRINTGCLKENGASERVMQKCGMRKEGELLLGQWHDGKMRDRVIYAINKSEWVPEYDEK